MYEQLRAIRYRSRPTLTRWAWRSWMVQLRQRRRAARKHELEVIERLHRIERERRRAGAHVAERSVHRRWC
jgi:hypothetical protein